MFLRREAMGAFLSISLIPVAIPEIESSKIHTNTKLILKIKISPTHCSEFCNDYEDSFDSPTHLGMGWVGLGVSQDHVQVIYARSAIWQWQGN